jgi:hypothetical protein
MVRGGQHEGKQLPFPCAADPHHGGVMVLAAHFVRVAARFGQESGFTPRLKVGYIDGGILVEIG